jgi:hypothetical protein
VILDLDLQYANGKSLYNNLGGKEYWYQATSTKAWYYLKPDGTLNKWSGKAGKLTGTVVDRLDPQVWYSPDTLLGSRTKSDEPWMNGFTFELVNSAGKVVATTTSQNLDRNRDGKINPELEQGWYRFQNVAPGSYTVREVVPKGWLQSASRTSPGAAEAYKLDQTLGLSVSGGLSEDFGGLGERWLKGKKGWYYITPIGDLFLWNGKAVTKNAPLSGTLVASPGASYFNDVSLLHAAKNPVLNVKAGAVLTRVDFGNFKPLTLQGQSYLSAIPTWIRNSPGFLIKLLSPAQAAKAGNPAVPALYAWAVVSTGNGKDDLIPYSSASAKKSSTGQQQSSGPKASSTASSSSTTGSAASTFNLNLLNSYGAAVIDNLFSSLNF